MNTRRGDEHILKAFNHTHALNCWTVDSLVIRVRSRSMFNDSTLAVPALWQLMLLQGTCTLTRTRSAGNDPCAAHTQLIRRNPKSVLLNYLSIAFTYDPPECTLGCREGVSNSLHTRRDEASDFWMFEQLLIIWESTKESDISFS